MKTIIDERLQKEPKLEIFSIEYEGRKFWVKRARKTGSNLLQHFVYMLTKIPLVTPVEHKNAQEALKFESSKIQELYDLSIPVPKVIEVSKEYFIIEDCGPTVQNLLRKNLLDNSTAIFENIIIQLAALHNLGKFHGGSLIKNITYKDEKLYFIDFEESFDKKIDIQELQFRDLFLFLFSLGKAKIEVNYTTLVNQYIDLTHNKDMIDKFHKLASKVSTLMKLVENKSLWNIVGTDTQIVYKLLQDIQKVPSLDKNQ